MLRQLTASIATVLAASAWAESATLLATIPGIGPVRTAWLLVTTLNFTVAENADWLTAYAGLAPMEHSSGTSVWSRPQIGHSGNSQLHTALYLATLSAARYNPVIKAVYDRLRAAGKPPKVARCATARKLLHLARRGHPPAAVCCQLYAASHSTILWHPLLTEEVPQYGAGTPITASVLCPNVLSDTREEPIPAMKTARALSCSGRFSCEERAFNIAHDRRRPSTALVGFHQPSPCGWASGWVVLSPGQANHFGKANPIAM